MKTPFSNKSLTYSEKLSILMKESLKGNIFIDIYSTFYRCPDTLIYAFIAEYERGKFTFNRGSYYSKWGGSTSHLSPLTPLRIVLGS